MRWPWTRLERALPPGVQLTFPGGGGSPTWALDTPVDADAAMRSAAVWSCVRLLADSVSTLPLDAFRGEEEVPLPRVLVEPAAGVSAQEWMYSVMVSLLLRGNAFGLITARSGATLLPAQVELVHPDLVGVNADPETGAISYMIGGREYDRDDVWHVKSYTMPGVVVGLSPVEYARQTIALGLAAEKWGGQFFGDSATPQGILTCQGDLSQDQAERIMATWKVRHSGRHGIALLTGGVKFEPISIAPDQAQFLETQRYNLTQIARVFGVPPEMVGGEAGNSLTYANVEGRALDFLRFSLNPWIVRLENSLSRLMPSTQKVKFNTGGLLRSTTMERYQAHKIALEAGFLTINEVRALEDLPPLPPAPPSASLANANDGSRPEVA